MGVAFRLGPLQDSVRSTPQERRGPHSGRLRGAPSDVRTGLACRGHGQGGRAGAGRGGARVATGSPVPSRGASSPLPAVLPRGHAAGGGDTGTVWQRAGAFHSVADSPAQDHSRLCEAAWTGDSASSLVTFLRRRPRVRATRGCPWLTATVQTGVGS